VDLSNEEIQAGAEAFYKKWGSYASVHNIAIEMRLKEDEVLKWELMRFLNKQIFLIDKGIIQRNIHGLQK